MAQTNAERQKNFRQKQKTEIKTLRVTREEYEQLKRTAFAKRLNQFLKGNK